MAGLIDYGIIQPGLANALIEQNKTRQMQQAAQERQNALVDLQLRAAQRGEEESLAEREAYKSQDPLAALRAAGLGKQAFEYEKRQKDMKASRIAQAKDALALTQSAAASIYQNPDPAYAEQIISRLQDATGQDLSADLLRLRSLNGDPTEIKKFAAGYTSTIDKLMPRFETQNIGGAIQRQGYDPVTGAPIGAPQVTPMMPQPKEVEAQKMRIAQAGKPSTTVVNLQEKAEAGARGKMLVGEYEDVSKSAKIAAKSLPSIDSNLAILSQGFNTGFGSDAKAAGAKVLAALGVSDAEKYATNAQSFLANASQAVLQRQLEQKGSQTEADAQRITQTGAQLGNTKRANEFLLSVAKAQFKRDMDQRNFYDKWWKDNKTYDGAESAWYSGEGSRSLFDRPELKQFATGTPVVGKKPAGSPAAPAANSQLSARDQQALEWANANSGDPRAAQIKQRLGAK